MLTHDPRGGDESNNFSRHQWVLLLKLLGDGAWSAIMVRTRFIYRARAGRRAFVMARERSMTS